MLIEPKRRKKKLKNLCKPEGNSIISTCCHYFIGEDPFDEYCDLCDCKSRGFCLPQCLCSEQCPIRRKGCRCKKEDCRSSRCDCYKMNMECDPLLCRNCFGYDKKNNCKNNQIMLRQFKKVRVGQSTISLAGLGLFAAETIKK